MIVEALEERDGFGCWLVVTYCVDTLSPERAQSSVFWAKKVKMENMVMAPCSTQYSKSLDQI